MSQATPHQVFYYNAEARLHWVPVSYTSLAKPDPFVEVSAGRAHLRIEDLLGLAKLIDELWDAKGVR